MGLFGNLFGGAAEAAGYRAMAIQARGEKRAAKAGLAEMKKTRQKVINPYQNVSNLSGLAKDLSGVKSICKFKCIYSRGRHAGRAN